MITRVTLYPGGLISCRDKDGYQLPSSQGLFKDVHEKIENLPESITWELFNVKKPITVTKKKFLKTANKMVEVSFEKIPAETIRLKLGL